MAAPRSNDEDKPLDPEVERVRRKLLRFMIINLVILFVAFAAVIGGFIYKSTSLAPKRPAGQEAGIQPHSGAEAVAGTIAIPAGARIVSQTLSGEEALLGLEFADGSRSFLLYDLKAGRTLGTYAVKAQ
jgi:hypothetical protein